MIEYEDKILLDEILVNCRHSVEVMAKTFFPERFYAPFSSIHRRIFDIVDDKSTRKSVVAAPRGFGKTSIVGLALAAQAILFRTAKFIVYVSNSATVAEMQTENLKTELLANTDIRKLFPDIRADKYEGVDEQFSKKAWVANGETLVLPRGSGQQVRGLLFRDSRPDLIIVDDLEDKETIGSEEVRAKRKEWFFSDLCKSVSQFGGSQSAAWRIVYIDTLKHELSLLAELLELPDWKSLRLSVCSDGFESLAPEFISTADIQQMVQEHRDAGTLDLFYSEYMNMAIAKEDATFRPEYFQHYNETDDDFLERMKSGHIESIVIGDPAKVAKMHSADSAVVGWGLDLDSNDMYVRDIRAGKMHPDEFYDAALDMAISLGARAIGLEVTSLNEFIVYPFKTRMLQRGLNFELIELKARAGTGEYAGKGKGKSGRIAALAPFYRKGQIKHNRRVCGVLETQLLSFPRSKRWDVMDAAAYVVEMMEMGGRYFSYKNAAQTPEDIEKEYAELEYDTPLDGWQVI